MLVWQAFALPVVLVSEFMATSGTPEQFSRASLFAQLWREPQWTTALLLLKR
jgi:hypothetical protein